MPRLYYIKGALQWNKTKILGKIFSQIEIFGLKIIQTTHIFYYKSLIIFANNLILPIYHQCETQGDLYSALTG